MDDKLRLGFLELGIWEEYEEQCGGELRDRSEKL